MSIFELVMISIGLGMDAFAVSICKGLSLHCPSLHNKLIISCYFGVFQGIMPIIGYFIGYYFSNFISSISHYIVFAILLIIGINMIKESSTSELSTKNNDISNKNLLFLAIATSIDALAVGISFACLKVNIFFSSAVICIITFVLCFIGVKIGSIFGNKFEKSSQILGGIILILIGLKILLEHL